MMRRKLDAEFKARVALEAIKEQKTIAEICSVYEVHGTQIGQWKKQGLAGIKASFSKKAGSADNEGAKLEMLYAQIGQLKVENDFLKKTVYPH